VGGTKSQIHNSFRRVLKIGIVRKKGGIPGDMVNRAKKMEEKSSTTRKERKKLQRLRIKREGILFSKS